MVTPRQQIRLFPIAFKKNFVVAISGQQTYLASHEAFSIAVSLNPFQGFFLVLPNANAISTNPTIGMMSSENSDIGGALTFGDVKG
jgi:hypothetical protein